MLPLGGTESRVHGISLYEFLPLHINPQRSQNKKFNLKKKTKNNTSLKTVTHSWSSEQESKSQGAKREKERELRGS